MMPVHPLPLASRDLPLPQDGLEEVCIEGGMAAGLGFVLAARGGRGRRGLMFAAPRAWIRERGRPLASGMPQGSTAGEAMLVAAPRTEGETLWALEEALRSKAVGLAIGAVEGASLLATRRLDWAARGAGAAVLLLKTRPARDLSAARRRWRVSPHPSGPPEWDPKASGTARWRVTLERSRDGATGDWIVEQDVETHRLRMVEGLAGHGVALGRRLSA